MKQTLCMRRSGVAALIGVCVMASAALGAPPKVVKATPDNGAKDVDAAKTRELRIVFDQAMDTEGGWSIVGGGESFPKLTGKPTWVNDRTLVWSMRLDPNHEYWLSINNENFTNFRSKNGEAAVPYPIAFKTAAGQAAAAKLTPADNRKAIEQLRRAIDEDYSYRDRMKVDWDKAFKAATPKLEAAETPKQFALAAATLLAPAEDMHLWLKVGDEIVPTRRRSVPPNMNMVSLSNAVPGFKRVNKTVFTGRFEDGIAYVMIATWGPEQEKELDPAFEMLADAKGLIVDVRPNSGGNDQFAAAFAGSFVDKPKPFAKDVVRSNGQTSKPIERVLEPNKARPAYRGKVAVLMGPHNMSSCESFILMMKQVPNCKLIGARSFGSSGNPYPQILENGVVVFVPCWQDMLLDGTCFEGKGIDPDIAVKAEQAEFLRGDPVLDAALKYLRSR